MHAPAPPKPTSPLGDLDAAADHANRALRCHAAATPPPRHPSTQHEETTVTTCANDLALPYQPQPPRFLEQFPNTRVIAKD
jgi:hypothetical protein